MTCAYDKAYLEKARAALGRMLDVAVNGMGYEIDAFFGMFIGSGLAARFEHGDPSLTVGKSGAELAYAVLETSGLKTERKPMRYELSRSAEYWAGWALAYYQWHSGLGFSEIASSISLSSICGMYLTFHEMDIRQFVDHMDELYRKANPAVPLQKYRLAGGFSQRQLAELSGVPVRSIQQYEQRQKSLDRAAYSTVANLARALCCEPSQLLGI